VTNVIATNAACAQPMRGYEAGINLTHVIKPPEKQHRPSDTTDALTKSESQSKEKNRELRRLLVLANIIAWIAIIFALRWAFF
jgi:hypothetical protein